MTEGYGTRILLIVIAARLTPLQREVFIDAAILERSQCDVAAELGLSVQAVSQALTRVRRKISRIDGIRELAA